MVQYPAKRTKKKLKSHDIVKRHNTNKNHRKKMRLTPKKRTNLFKRGYYEL
jgi:hypothetical protein